MPQSRKRQKSKSVDKTQGNDKRMLDVTNKNDAKRWILTVVSLAIAILVIAGFGLQSFASFSVGSQQNSSGAQVGDHWHAKINVVLCDFTSTIPPSPGDVHSHGDGMIHIHPASTDTAGDKANLGAFFDSTQMKVMSDSILVRGEEILKNGDKCSDESSEGKFELTINGKNYTLKDFRSYLPLDTDEISLSFK